MLVTINGNVYRLDMTISLKETAFLQAIAACFNDLLSHNNIPDLLCM
jgi:hypothetical protein